MPAQNLVPLFFFHLNLAFFFFFKKKEQQTILCLTIHSLDCYQVTMPTSSLFFSVVDKWLTAVPFQDWSCLFLLAFLLSTLMSVLKFLIYFFPFIPQKFYLICQASFIIVFMFLTLSYVIFFIRTWELPNQKTNNDSSSLLACQRGQKKLREYLDRNTVLYKGI